MYGCYLTKKTFLVFHFMAKTNYQNRIWTTIPGLKIAFFVPIPSTEKPYIKTKHMGVISLRRHFWLFCFMNKTNYQNRIWTSSTWPKNSIFPTTSFYMQKDHTSKQSNSSSNKFHALNWYWDSVVRETTQLTKLVLLKKITKMSRSSHFKGRAMI